MGPSARGQQLANELEEVKADSARKLREANDLLEQQRRREIQAGAEIVNANSKLQEVERS